VADQPNLSVSRRREDDAAKKSHRKCFHGVTRIVTLKIRQVVHAGKGTAGLCFASIPAKKRANPRDGKQLQKGQ